MTPVPPQDDDPNETFHDTVTEETDGHAQATTSTSECYT